jgi:choline dehydrogenase-like flavoprotein
VTGPDAASTRSDRRIETDICVIGAGPAGIAFAREWIGSSLRVDILESGGLAPEPDAQDLGAGITTSGYLRRDSIRDGRARAWGGTANTWLYTTQPTDGRAYARSVPPEPIDFAPMPAAGRDGWPIAFDELAAWYPRAQACWNGAPFDYRPDRWGAAEHAPLSFADGILRTGIVQHGPHDAFTLRYRDDLRRAPNVRIHVRHTVLALEGDATGDTIRLARAVEGEGNGVEIHARMFVVAGGGIENAQLLLLSDPTRPGGPGNRHDVVGRWVTDHPEFRMGALEPTGTDVFNRLGLYDIRWVDGFMVAGMLTIADDVKAARGLLNTSVALVPQPAAFGSAANRSLATLAGLARRQVGAGLGRDVATVVRHPMDVARAIGMRNRPYHEFAGGWSGPGSHRDRFRTIEVYAASEQAPDPDNRVTLDTRRDALGRQRPRLRWEWSAADRRNVEGSIGLYVDALEAAGLGHFRRWVELDGPGRPSWTGIHHPMGATRMHADPREGVVDAECAVHGIANLYVAGSSVFPTGNGYANPTLTILALAIRLADHLKSGTASNVAEGSLAIPLDDRPEGLSAAASG